MGRPAAADGETGLHVRIVTPTLAFDKTEVDRISYLRIRSSGAFSASNIAMMIGIISGLTNSWHQSRT